MVAASIRYNNPGAMWGSALSRKWGATGDLVLNDGQKNHIAIFPTPIDGAAAQFDLWRKGYTGVTLAQAISKWSGGNSPGGYVAFLANETDLKATDIITPAVLAGPSGIALMKAQARWEAGMTGKGQTYPLTDASWKLAQRMVFAAPPPSVVALKPTTAVATTAATGAVVAAVSGVDWKLIGIAFIVGGLAMLAYQHRAAIAALIAKWRN